MLFLLAIGLLAAFGAFTLMGPWFLAVAALTLLIIFVVLDLV